MIEKNRGNEVILEMVEALKNKNFEFPRADYVYRRVLSLPDIGRTLSLLEPLYLCQPL